MRISGIQLAMLIKLYTQLKEVLRWEEGGERRGRDRPTVTVCRIYQIE